MEAMEKVLYRVTPRAKDGWLVAILIVGAIASLYAASTIPWWAAGFYGLWLAVAVVKRFWRGFAPPELSWRGSTLTFREYHAPHASHSVSVQGLEHVVVAGPLDDRRFFFYFRDGTNREIRPFFSSRFSKRAAAFLREVLPPEVELEIKPRPSFMEQVRGNYP